MENARQLEKLSEKMNRTDERFVETDKRLNKLSENQDRTDRQLAKTDAQLAKTDAQLAKTDAQLAKTDAQLAKTDAQLAKTDAQLAKTDEKLKKMMEYYGNISSNIGDAAEEYFFNSLLEKKELNNIKYDTVERNDSRHKGNVQEEYDIILSNGEYLSIVEIKHKVVEGDVEKLRGKKVKNFRYLYPHYKDHKIFLAVAGIIVQPKVESLAKSYGLMVIKQKGDTIEVIGDKVKVF